VEGAAACSMLTSPPSIALSFKIFAPENPNAIRTIDFDG
jgi:hypothetical protein